MKKFKFTLQSVHDVRTMREEREQMVLSQLYWEADQAAELLGQVEGAILTAIENYNRKAGIGEAINVVEMEMNSRHISQLERKKAEAREELNQRRYACSQQVIKLADAAREVKITGKLRENQVTAHRNEMNLAEQNSIDEMVTTGFARKMGESR
jgi:flagellar export protein FliJ